MSTGSSGTSPALFLSCCTLLTTPLQSPSAASVLSCLSSGMAINYLPVAASGSAAFSPSRTHSAPVDRASNDFKPSSKSRLKYRLRPLLWKGSSKLYIDWPYDGALWHKVTIVQNRIIWTSQLLVFQTRTSMSLSIWLLWAFLMSPLLLMIQPCDAWAIWKSCLKCLSNASTKCILFLEAFCTIGKWQKMLYDVKKREKSKLTQSRIYSSCNCK